jgi:hypothetical protein
MRRLARVVAAVVGVASVLAGVSGTASAAPGAPPSVLGSFTVDPGDGGCAAPVQVTFIGEPQAERQVGRGAIFTDGGEYTLFTNTLTGASARIAGSGIERVSTAADGSLTVAVNGAILLFGQPGLPGIAVNIGAFRRIIDAGGDIVSQTLSGHLVDVCSAIGA